MWPGSVVCMSVCCAHRLAVIKTDEPIEMPFEGHTGTQNYLFHGSRSPAVRDTFERGYAWISPP